MNEEFESLNSLNHADRENEIKRLEDTVADYKRKLEREREVATKDRNALVDEKERERDELKIVLQREFTIREKELRTLIIKEEDRVKVNE